MRIKRFLRFFSFISLCLSLLFVPYPGYAEQRPVIVIPIKGEIDAGQAALVQRAYHEAQNRNAQAVLMEIDTFGGAVDAAVQIRDVVIDSSLETIVYIKNRAWSAGALISLAHKHIAIAPGGSIGAAEPIPTTEKTIAALKAEFAATASKTGRNARVAEAMVDKSLGYPGYAEPGKILALTDYQAKEVGYADLIASERATVLAHYSLGEAPVIEHVLGWQEKAAGLLSNPTVKSLLLTVIFLAVMTEIKTAGMGVAAIVGLIAAGLFFGSQWITGLAGWLEILLFLFGIAFVLFELYTPGLGLFGLAGVGCIFASLFLTLGGGIGALNILAVSIIVSLLLFLLILRFLPSSRLWAKMVLKESEDTQSGYVSGNDYSHYLGRTGKALTLLRPAGTVEIDGVQLDVITGGQFIKPGSIVKVVDVSANRIVVKLLTHTTINEEDQN